MGQSRPIFVYFSSFQQLYRKNVDFSGIRTRIVGMNGQHSDHLITTAAQHFVKGRIEKVAYHVNTNQIL